MLRAIILLTISLSFGCVCFSQQPADPNLLFREDWKEIPAEIPVSQKHVNNPDLILHLHGAGQDSIKKSHHDTPIDDPYYIWSGICIGNWMVSLEHKTINFDLSENAKVVWRGKQAGFRQLRLTLKLNDGTWLVSDQFHGTSTDWEKHEFNISEINWYSLNPELISEVKKIEKPNLSKVEQVGFTDLMTGGLSAACSRLDWIEVYGKPVKK